MNQGTDWKRRAEVLEEDMRALVADWQKAYSFFRPPPPHQEGGKVVPGTTVDLYSAAMGRHLAGVLDRQITAALERADEPEEDLDGAA